MKENNKIELYKPDEVFVDIKGYEGRYQISNYGRCLAVERQKKTSEGTIPAHLLKPRYNNKGYMQYELNKDGVGKQFLAHRLVAMHFLTNENDLPVVNHLNEQHKTFDDTFVGNLEYCTYGDNLSYSGINQSYLVKCVETGEVSTIKEAAQKLNCHYTTIRNAAIKGKKSMGYHWEVVEIKDRHRTA